MSDILKEVRAISSQKIAEKKTLSENNYPKLIEKIKQSAGWGKTSCEFSEHEIDEYSRRLLQQDGFNVIATSKPAPKYDYLHQSNKEPISIWRVSW